MNRSHHHRQRSAARQQQTGFTLMEMLVAMTIVSLLATTILFGWRIAAAAWGRASELTEEQRRASAVNQVLLLQMAEMLPVAPSTRPGARNVFFQGEASTARFLSRYSLVNRSRSGIYRIEYQIADRSDGLHELLLNEVPVSGPSDFGSLLTGVEQTPQGMLARFAPFQRTPQTRVLLDDLSEAHFEYYRPATLVSSAAWVRQWVGQGNELPRAMAIRFTPRPAAGRLQPGSIVASVENDSQVRR